MWRDCPDSRVGLLERLLACECDRIGGAGLCLQSTWKEPAATNGRGEHTGNDARVVGVTHDLSMPQTSCPDVSPLLSLSHTLSLTFITFPLTLSWNIHLLSFYIWHCLFLAIAYYTSHSQSLSDTQKWWCNIHVLMKNVTYFVQLSLNKKHRIYLCLF